MNNKIFLSVRNTETGEDYIASCTLPARMGKHPDSGNQILFDAKFRAISRVHGMIEHSARGLHYTDSSANGSRVNGLVVRDAKVALSGRYEIEIGGYIIRPAEANPIVILSTDASLLEFQRMDLVPGRGIGVVRRSSTLALVDLNRWTEWDKSSPAHFQVLADQNMLVVDNDAERAGIRINKSPVNRTRTTLTPLDVVEIEGFRFEVLDPHQRSIVCRHATCQLLNTPPYEQDCRWCGRHLANTGAVSRVL